MPNRPFELEVQALKLQVLAMAQQQGLAPDVVICALADVVGLTAALLDRKVAAVPIDTRLDAFIERARHAHRMAGLPAASLARELALPG